MRLRISDIRLPLDHTPADLEARVLKRLHIAKRELVRLSVYKRSIDARKRGAVSFLYTVDVEVKGADAVLKRISASAKVSETPDMSYNPVFSGKPDSALPRPVVVGTGPCGLFAGLVLAQMGFCPILMERGREVGARLDDVNRFWQTGELCPQSNVQFGEGGAGTFSDGKLYTQIKDRNNRCRKILEELVAAGAPCEILTDYRPHIGTDRLVGVVRNLREAIIRLGGEVRFETQVTDLVVRDGLIRAVVTGGGEEVRTDSVVLAIGHSARDTFDMLFRRGVSLSSKPFSVGLRIEHPQQIIDVCQYGDAAGHPALGAADYRLVHHASNERTVYTFCMCPGGHVINASSEPGRLVVNGMSCHARNSGSANSALLVGVHPSDYGSDHPLAGVAYQRRWEESAFRLGGGGFRAPAQRVEEFLAQRCRTDVHEPAKLNPTCLPGVTVADLNECLPSFAAVAMREAIPGFDRKLPGFAMPGAWLTGVETRSSSPVRIDRGRGLESKTVQGLYPAGEGSGYAGGIISSAVDGIRAAEAIAHRCGK